MYPVDSPPIVDRRLLERFERELDPQHPERSRIPARVLGFGEISSIFAIDAIPEVAFKRLPIFQTVSEGEAYAHMFHTYCRHLAAAGLSLPGQAAAAIPSAGAGAALYIAQRRLPERAFGHHLIHREDPGRIHDLIRAIVIAIGRVWSFNAAHRPHLELALDGQLSNWARHPHAGDDDLVYIDTSTPLFRVDGREQLDPEKLLQSAPAALRWILRRFFLADVMNRYYDRRAVLIDLLANLHKEQRPELIASLAQTVNRWAAPLERPITPPEVHRYYRSDRTIWTLFLAFRRLDRWLTRNLYRRRYEFILPGPIKR
jgi:hypothetical protein